MTNKERFRQILRKASRQASSGKVIAHWLSGCQSWPHVSRHQHIEADNLDDVTCVACKLRGPTEMAPA